MVEAVQKSLESEHETRTRATGFEPDVLAFCCEH